MITSLFWIFDFLRATKQDRGDCCDIINCTSSSPSPSTVQTSVCWL